MDGIWVASYIGGYIGIMENRMETTIMGGIGGYIGIMENTMETTIMGYIGGYNPNINPIML